MRSPLSLRVFTRTAAAAGTAAALLLLGIPAQAASGGTRVNEVDLVSGPAPGTGTPLVDGNAVNPWGLAFSPTGPLWAANNASNTATVYSGGVDGATPKLALTVNVPSDGPSGQVFNDDSTQFQIAGPNGTQVGSNFIFDTESGDVDAWAGAADLHNAFVEAQVPGAVYKGLALVHNTMGSFLLAANFATGRIDVFDTHFQQVAVSRSAFADPYLPRGFAPFGVAVIGDSVYVSYAKQDAAKHDPVHGVGLGFVNRFDLLGQNRHRIASRGTLNAPWGMTTAPASFGALAGDLLVGNFGNGWISVFHNGHFHGLLRLASGRPVKIDGLWALLPGTANTGGTNNLWFSAGPNMETAGLIGLLTPAASTASG